MQEQMRNVDAIRRDFLRGGAFGLAPVALSWLLHHEAAADPVKPNIHQQKFSLTARAPKAEPQAKAMISLFMQGGPSHIDLLDPKPALNKLDGKQFPGTIKYDNAAQASSRVLGCPWKFREHGECGTPVSELLPGLAEGAALAHM